MKTLEFDMLASMALRETKKTTTETLYNTIMEMMLSDQCTASDEVKADILRYFYPRRMAFSKRSLPWLRRAVAGNNDPRGYLTGIWSDENKVYATDGYRLHTVYIEAMNKESEKYQYDLPPGWYNAKNLTSYTDDNWKWNYAKAPNYESVIPQFNVREYKPFPELFDVVDAHKFTAGTRDSVGPFIQLKCLDHSNAHFNIRYIFDALSGFEHPVYAIRSGNTAMSIIEDPNHKLPGREAIIMPRRI